MAFNPTDFNIEVWLRLEIENVLQKVCSIYDVDGRLVEEYKTRISVVPFGKYPSGSTVKSISAPSLYRAFFYDVTGAMIARVPEMREWTQACEDAATGGILIPNNPSILPHGISAAPTVILYDEDLAVPVGVDTNILSYTVPVSTKSYVRNIRFSGDNRAVYRILKNSIKIREVQTWWARFDDETFFGSSDGGLVLIEGDVLDILVFNKGTDPVRFTASMSFVNAQ